MLPDILMQMIRHGTELTVAAILQQDVVHPSVMASHKYCPSSKLDSVVTGKSECRELYLITWHRTATCTSSVSICRE